MTKVYIVYKVHDSLDDYYEVVARIFNTRKKAETFISKAGPQPSTHRTTRYYLVREGAVE